MRVRLSFYLLLASLVLPAVLAACSNVTNVQPTPQSIEFHSGTLPPSRAAEEYALWAEFPAKTISSPFLPQHGLYNTQLVTTFRIDSGGQVIGFDTTGFRDRVGLSYALIVQAEVSVEQIGKLGTFPANTLAFGVLSGSGDVAVDTLKSTHFYALGDSVRNLRAVATLASAPATPNDYRGEVYLMTATNSTSAALGLSGYTPMTSPWKFAVWTVDSSASPAVNTFLGYVTAPDRPDTKAAGDHFPFPGGRTPNDPSQPIRDLTTGHGSILLTAEPAFAGTDPVSPFGAVVLRGAIPSNQAAFKPFNLQNQSDSLPWAILVVHR